MTEDDPFLTGDEVQTLVLTLERIRRTLAWKCSGLDAAGMRATVGTSTMTLGGILKHLALVEDHYFSLKLRGRDPEPIWAHVDWDADPSWEWRTAADDTPEQLRTLWEQAVARSRTALDEALAEDGLGQLLTRITNGRGQSPSLRRTLADLIEEYARHTGHADLIRESVDGLTGEDAPR